MSAIEYGSYYWCVILQGSEESAPESVHLHADEMEIDAHGTLLFRSAGRRPAGADPQNPKSMNGDSADKQEHTAHNDQGGDKRKSGEKKDLMTYVAFAPGTWTAVYAAKLSDGTAAAVERWSAADGRRGLLAAVPASAGAAGYFPKE